MIVFLWCIEIACWAILADAALVMFWPQRSEWIGPVDLLTRL